MSKTIKSIQQKKEELSRREMALKKNLETHSGEMKKKAMSVGKIALISGLVALAGYWVYTAFFESEEKESKKKAKKKKRAVKNTSSRLAEMALPYVGKVLDSLFKEDDPAKSAEPEMKVTED